MSDTDIAAMLPPDPPSEEKDPASESVANLQITSGCAYDVTHCLDRIVELFDENEELRYQYFLEVWKEMNFGLIYCGREYFRELHEFTEDLLEIAKQHMLSPHTQAHRAAAIYLIYGLYFKQPLVEKVRIRITKPELEDLLEFLVLCREEQHWDLIYVWKKLIKDRAFYWSASDTMLGIELALSVQQRSTEKREIFRNQDKNPFKTEEFQTSLGDLMRIDKKYHSLKEALRNQMGGHDKGLSLTKEGQMTTILEISETVYTAESAVDGDGDRSGGRWTRGGNVLKGKDGTTIGDRRKALRDRAFQKEQEVGRLTKELQALQNPTEEEEETADPDWDVVEEDGEEEWDPSGDAASGSKKRKKSNSGPNKKKGGANKVGARGGKKATGSPPKKKRAKKSPSKGKE